MSLPLRRVGASSSSLAAVTRSQFLLLSRVCLGLGFEFFRCGRVFRWRRNAILGRATATAEPRGAAENRGRQGRKNQSFHDRSVSMGEAETRGAGDRSAHEKRDKLYELVPLSYS